MAATASSCALRPSITRTGSPGAEVDEGRNEDGNEEEDRDEDQQPSQGVLEQARSSFQLSDTGLPAGPECILLSLRPAAIMDWVATAACRAPGPGRR